MQETKLAQQGYEHYYGMLSDKIRMQAYRDAIFNTVKSGDVVVDLGAGTGLLGIWAIQAGASKVYAIEKTNAIELAKVIAQKNNCLDKFEFINENSMNISLAEKADVLISETLGSFAVDENTLLFTNDARDRLLKKEGSIIPQSLELFVAPIDDALVYGKVDFWRNIEGVDFSPAFDLFSKKIMVESVNPKGLMSQPVSLGCIDLMTITENSFQAGQYIPVTKKGWLHGVAGWFTVRLCEGVEINTAPSQQLTHWKQAFFPFNEPIEVIKGDVLDWKVSVAEKEVNSDDTFINYQYRCTQLKNERVTAEAVKVIGRNDACPCGSGKKYKKCCMV